MKISFSSIPLTLLVAFLFISPLSTTAQTPGLGIFFQAIARDKMDNPAKYRKIYIQTSIIESANSTGSFLTEIHQSTTDANGIFNISIGQGKQTSGIANDLLSIPWSKGPLLLNLKIAIEPLTPLSNWDYTKEWIDLGTTPFGTVPYALSAGNTTTIADINKVNVKDSNLIYATPYQLSLKTFDTGSLSNRINNKLFISDTSKMLSPYSKQNQVNNSLNLKLNISDTSSMLYPFAKNIDFIKYKDSISNFLNSNIVASNNGIVLPDATISTKGILKLAGDLTGTANAPTIADGVVTNNKIASGISASKVGLANVDNTADISKPISTLTQDALNLKLNTTDTATMLSNYLTNMHTTKNLIDTKLNKADTAAMLSNFLTNMHTTKNAIDSKLNKADTAAMLSNYLTNMYSTKNAIDTKLNKTDTAAMLSNYLTNMHFTKNAIDTKLNKTDTATMLSNYLTNIHTTNNELDTKELITNKSNDATLGGSTPSTNLYPTQSAVKQYITNNASTGTTSTTNNWSVLGNTGMVDGTNFIGTTDAQPLNLVANNINSGRIDVSAISGQTSLGYGSGVNTIKNTSNFYGTKNTSIGYQTLYNTVYGKENTAIGYQALYNNNTASGSTAIGYQAMYNAYNISTSSAYSTSNTAVGYQALLGSSTPANNSGISNTAIGHYAERSNSTGSNNTGIGDLSLYYNLTGQSNTAIGYNTLSSITTGSSNTAIGYNADVTNNVSNATAIGNGAIASTSNTIQLGNGSVAIVNTEGIYTSSNNTESNYQNSGALVVAGGVGVGKNLYVGGKIVVERIDIKHLRGISTLPVMTLGSGAGTITSFVSNTGTDLAGNVTFKSGSGSYNSNNSIILTITFNIPYGTIPYVVISPANSTTASLTAAQAVYVIANSNGFSIYSNSTALPALNYNYSWNYIVVQ